MFCLFGMHASVCMCASASVLVCPWSYLIAPMTSSTRTWPHLGLAFITVNSNKSPTNPFKSDTGLSYQSLHCQPNPEQYDEQSHAPSYWWQYVATLLFLSPLTNADGASHMISALHYWTVWWLSCVDQTLQLLLTSVQPDVNMISG